MATQQWCLLDVNQLNDTVKHLKCSDCNQQTLRFSRDDVNLGFCYTLSLHCSTCETVVSKTFTSPRSKSQHVGPFTVNDLMVLHFNQLGQGYTAQKQFATLYGMKGLHHKTFSEKESKVIRAVISNTEEVLKESVLKVKAAHLAVNSDTCIDPLSLTVSFDGSWMKRGHTSMYGVAAVIDVLTGLVVDYIVLSKFCHACTRKKVELGDTSKAYQEWYTNHKEECAINYEGSSNAMEPEAARRLWSRSEYKLGLRYTGFLSDGDSKAYNAVLDMNVYPPGFAVVKEECVNHVHKRMGKALLTLTKKMHLGGTGFGRLTQGKALQFQNYYRGAVMNNIGDVDKMRDAIWATLYHCSSTDENPQHHKCPAGSKSWCFYQQAIADEKELPSHATSQGHQLAENVANAMVPVYERMSDTNLLGRMVKGKTQNANESLHSVIWSRCPKTIFVGVRQSMWCCGICYCQVQ